MIQPRVFTAVPICVVCLFQCCAAFPKIRRKIATTININYYLDCIHMAAIFLWLHIRVGNFERWADVTPLCSALQVVQTWWSLSNINKDFCSASPWLPRHKDFASYYTFTKHRIVCDLITFTITFNFPDNFCMSLDCGWKPEHLEKTPRSLQCQVRTERRRPSRVWNPGSSCYCRQSTENSLTLRQGEL